MTDLGEVCISKTIALITPFIHFLIGLDDGTEGSVVGKPLPACRVALPGLRSLAEGGSLGTNDQHPLSAHVRGTSCRHSPFTGGFADATEWWHNLAITGNKSPLKRFVTVMYFVIPHVAEVER